MSSPSRAATAAAQGRAPHCRSPGAAACARRAAWRRTLSRAAAWTWLAWVLPVRAIDMEHDPEIREVRTASARDAGSARAYIGVFRDRAMARGQLDRRLALDELDCRLLQDLDKPKSLEVAQQGAAALAAAVHPSQDAVLAGWRLAACEAGAQLDLGQVRAGEEGLERIVAATRQHDGLAPALALALLERGAARSRRGALLAGQADLLEACTALEKAKLGADLELCHWHLAGHYKRSGDFADAQRLLEPLLDAARRRHATADISVYAFGIGQLRVAAGHQAEALEAFAESLQAARTLDDRVGISYAESELARALLDLGQSAQALPHARRALDTLPSGIYDVEFLQASITLARALNHQHQPGQALARLDSAQKVLDELDRAAYRADWLGERAEALAGLGRWAEAYDSLQARQRIDQQINREKLSEQSARLRAEYNRGRDLASLEELNHLNAQSERLLHMQAAAITLGTLLLAASVAFGLRKMRQSRALHRLAMIDELTGLPNRRAVRQRLQDRFALARRLDRPLAVLMIDIDRFKAINDTHGHAVGDEVLRHLGKLLAAGVRQDDWVGRLGGEEFLAVLPSAGPEQAAEIAERMCRIARSTGCASSAGVLDITISIGVATLTPATTDVDALVEQADALLYQAKQEGRDRVVSAVPAGAGFRPAGTAPGTVPGLPA